MRVLLSVVAASWMSTAASAQQVDVQVPQGAGSVGSSAAGSVTGTGLSNSAATTLTPNLAPSMGVAPAPSLNLGANASPTLGLQPSAKPSAAPALNATPSAAPSVKPSAVPGRTGTAPALTATPQAAPFLPTAPFEGAKTGKNRAGDGGGERRDAAGGAGRDRELPTANAELKGAANGIGAAKTAEASGVDGVSVARALDRVFDAAAAAPGLKAGGASASVAGRTQTVREVVAQKISIANTAAPTDAPSLYQDAIKTAKDALPAPLAEAVSRVVRGFASHKADASLQDLATESYQAAASGSAPETNRRLAAFDKWETLLGAPGRPLISNAAALKDGARALLDKAAAGGKPSAPHIWLAKKNGAYEAVLPGGGIAAVPALAAAFALSPAALPAPVAALSDAYAAFSADPRAGNGAGLIYRARRALGESVPGAALSAGRYWLRTWLSSLWRRLTALFLGAPEYRLVDAAGRASLRRDAALAESARGSVADARRRLAAPTLTVAGARAALASLIRAASSLQALTGEGDAAAAVRALSRGFESAAAARRLSDSDELPPGLSELIAGPGAVSHWADLIDRAATTAVDARFWRSRSGADFVNLGAERSPAAGVAAVAKELSPAPAAFVALDERLWARGRGPSGEVRLTADLRATDAGGSLELTVENGGSALARRLEAAGLTILPSGSGLRAVAGSQDFSRDAGELGALAARALSAALGAADAPVSAELAALADAARVDPSGSAKLAAALDGREAFARAPVIGMVGSLEALAPTPALVGGKTVLVSALRDPATGLLAYARVLRAK